MLFALMLVGTSSLLFSKASLILATRSQFLSNYAVFYQLLLMTILRKIDFYINESLTTKYRDFLIGFDHIPFFPDQLEFFHFFQLYFFCPYFL